MASKRRRSEALAAWLAGQRWYATKTRRVAAIEDDDWIPIGGGGILIASVHLDDGRRDRYAIPLTTEQADEPTDALGDPGFCRALLEVVATGARAAGRAGEVVGTRGSAFPERLLDDLPVRRLGAEQSNTSIAFGDALIMKHFRRLLPGVNPDLEMSRFLTERARFPHTPGLAGSLAYRSPDAVSTLAVVHELVRAATDGWEWMLAALRDFYARVPLATRADAHGVRRLALPTLADLEGLGRITGALHQALASASGDGDFAPEPITAADLARWASDVERQVAEARRAIGEPLPLASAAVSAGLGGLAGRRKIRHHGDFHLGQTLHRREGGFVILDFEGEPLRPLAERRLRHAAVRDVAGMLRSFDYAATAARPAGSERLREWGERWEADAAAAFLTGYETATAGAAFLPDSPDARRRAIAVFEAEKAAYEIVYEANQRPGWVAIPRRGFLRAAARLGSAAAGAA